MDEAAGAELAALVVIGRAVVFAKVEKVVAEGGGKGCEGAVGTRVACCHHAEDEDHGGESANVESN